MHINAVGIYLTVTDLSAQDEDEEWKHLRRWLTAVHLRAPQAPIVVAATHYEKRRIELAELDRKMAGLFCKLEGSSVVGLGCFDQGRNGTDGSLRTLDRIQFECSLDE